MSEADLTKLSKRQLLEKCAAREIPASAAKTKAGLVALLTASATYPPQPDAAATEPAVLNTYTVGDNLELLRASAPAVADLVYFDPPYNTGRDFGDFDDRYESMEIYCNFMRPRIVECRRVLKPTGTIVIHVDPSVSHHFRYMCDAVFGAANFRNEISWQTGGNAKNTRKLNRYHDTIIVYANGPRQVFHPLYFPYGDEYMKKSNVKECPTHHKKYVTTALHNSQPDVNPRPNLRYEWNGHAKQWYVTADKMRALHDDARLEYSALGVPRIKRFLDEMEGVPLRDVWTDITNVQGGEKLAYATQKPVKLLERIVRLYTDEGAVCMDIFAGSGTLGRAALACGRRYVLYDQNPDGKAVFDESIR